MGVVIVDTLHPHMVFFGWCTHVILSAAAAVEEVFWKFLKASLWFILHAPVAVSHSVRRLPGGQVQ